jgi:hypothetical protein
MKQKILNRLPKKTATYTQKKRAYLDVQIQKAAQENQGLLNLAREYIFHAGVEFEEANPIQGLCNYHNTKPMALKHLGRRSAEYLVRVLNQDNHDITVPDYVDYRRIDLEHTIKSFKFLNLASQLDELMGDRTRQDFYNQSKKSGLIKDDSDKQLFYKIADNLTGTGRYFGHSYINENQDLEPLCQIISKDKNKLNKK